MPARRRPLEATRPGFGTAPASLRRLGMLGTRLLRATSGFTVVELLLSCALLGTIAAIFIPYFRAQIEQTRLRAAIMELRLLTTDISIYRDVHGILPESLDDLPRQVPLDVWGEAYVYVPLEGAQNLKGLARKDRWENPVNTDYDLYSMGPDRDTNQQLQVKAGRDDIVRGRNGLYFGRAVDFAAYVADRNPES